MSLPFMYFDFRLESVNVIDNSCDTASLNGSDGGVVTGNPTKQACRMYFLLEGKLARGHTSITLTDHFLGVS